MSSLKPRIWADLHTHSTASDGQLTPDELVRAAARAGLKALAVTDHDTLDGLDEAEPAGRGEGIEIVPGVEINTDAIGAEVHVLGYYLDRSDPDLNVLLGRLRDNRLRRGEEMVRRLRQIGFDISWDRVRELAQGGVIGRPHVAKTLEEAGCVRTVREAFERLLSPGCPGYVPHLKLKPGEAVREIRKAGGVAVLAHPGQLLDRVEGLAGLVGELIADGLQGLEVYHPDHDRDTSARLAALACSLGLLVTGGSDYHGPGSIDLGYWGAERSDFEALKKAAQFGG